jgi:hypothetical protein
MITTSISAFSVFLLIGILRLVGVVPPDFNYFCDLTLAALGGLTLTLAIQILTGLADRTQVKSAPSFPSSGSDNAAVLQGIREIKEALQKSATASGVNTVQQNVASRVSEMERNLLAKIPAAAVAAVEASEMGSLRASIAGKDKALSEAKSEETRLTQQLQREAGLTAQAEERARLAHERNDATLKDKALQGDQLAEALRRLEAQTHLTQEAQGRIASITAEQEKLLAEGKKAYHHLVPAALRETELNAQMEQFHSDANAGDAASASVWSSLITFGSAQADPAAKDFQLQIVRRLGTVLVQYWKHKGLNEKERHENLSVWAKCLNEHADGRYNLFVPGLGAPIDRNRMACSTSATSVREVLCWQVRNPTGSNFSLADVA